MDRKGEGRNPFDGNLPEPETEIPTVNIEDADNSDPTSTSSNPGTSSTVDEKQEQRPPSDTVGGNSTRPDPDGKDVLNVSSLPKYESSTKSEKGLLSPKSDRLVRSTSLKTSNREKSSGEKKIVRFADALGLDLADIRHFGKDEGAPVIPQSAFSDLKLESASNKHLTSGGTVDGTNGKYKLVPQFEQPGSDPLFMSKLLTQKVCLENTLISNLQVIGIGRTLKWENEKSIQVRYTTDEWKSSKDIDAEYLTSAHTDNFSETFNFVLNVPKIKPGERLIFALRFIVDKDEFWDNNSGQNYILECQTKKES